MAVDLKWKKNSFPPLFEFWPSQFPLNFNFDFRQRFRMLLAANYRPRGVYTDGRTILVISNLSVQGVEPASNYNIWGLPYDYYGVVQWMPPGNNPPDAHGFINVLKGAILTSDLISTVSEGYASEY
ncbi:hypothetical protein POM88_009226 [Heracleum sosnowskyi]|uniref:Starch synthase catalytic domain-containing protein n=1 Tax=Heracleum sosnowskyi TaxID=360622 RepID=A0AAD8N9B5_9APIA|nr:hypothetical protein POM88_009226 [Heracleum sosnowskyi]